MAPLEIFALEPRRQDPKQLEVSTSRVFSNDAVATVDLDARHVMLLDVMPGECGGRSPSRPPQCLNHHLFLPLHHHRLLLPLDDW